MHKCRETIYCDVSCYAYDKKKDRKLLLIKNKPTKSFFIVQFVVFSRILKRKYGLTCAVTSGLWPPPP